MNKREFLKTSGLLSLASVLPMGKTWAATQSLKKPSGTGCVLIPIETSGPYPLDLTANSTFFRQNITENKTGAPLNLRLKIIGDSNCLPIPNLRVNIWHCDKDGLYSGYDVQGNAGQAGLTYLRGFQFTDANGECSFTTIFPGWYTGRTCHIHFQVYVSSAYAAVSQLTFDPTLKNAVYAANPTLYTKGADPMTPATDGIFSDGYSYQLATLTPSSASGGYDAYLEVTIQGTGVTTGFEGHLEKQNARYFRLGQNFPNPYTDVSAIPFSLTEAAEVSLDLYDLQGRKVYTASSKKFSPGDYQWILNMREAGVVPGNFVYQIEVRNSFGIFRDSKMMTFGK